MANLFKSVLAIAIAVFSAPAAATNPSRTVIIAMAGLSNEVAPGLGAFKENAGTTNDYRICEIGRAPWHVDRSLVCPATEPLDNLGHGQGHGSGMETLRYYARKAGNIAANDVLLAVPGAAGGTSILQWNGIEAYHLPPNASGPQFDLNGDLMSRIDLAKAQPNPFVAFFMIALSQVDIEKIARGNDPDMQTGQDYANNLQMLASTWRARYGRVPIIFVPHPPGWVVNQPQRAQAANDVMNAVNALNLPCFAIVDTRDLKDNSYVTGDPTTSNHYTAQAFEAIAVRAVYDALPAALATCRQ